MTELTALEAIVLAALADRPRYGYELVERIAELTNGRKRVRPGNLYRVLERLEARGLAEETRSALEKGEDERRRYFRATAAGVRAAESELAMYSGVLRRAGGLRERPADG
ncbi:MAG TPA: PadR family transcriptional regulator [Longimicrobiales bacterium]|nr:PadR family transcriptional regulator [Longimicrobiales bacterium]